MNVFRVLFSLVAVASIVVACQASASTTPTSPIQTATPASASPSPTASAAPTATPLPRPLSVGGATFFTGTAQCGRVADGTETTDAAGIHGRDNVMECVYAVDEPRLDGKERLTFDFDAWGPMGVLAVQWGHGRITTAGGVWEGEWSGVVLPGTRDEISLWYAGSGGYEGFTLYLRITGSMGDYDVEGLVFEGTAPPR